MPGVAESMRMQDLQKKIQFYGTPEKGYLDSGLWTYLKYVYTKDEHDSQNPVKLLMGDKARYMYIVFLFWLACSDILVPKSRQIRMSWMGCAFCSWFARTAPYRLVLYQTEKEEKAWDQTTCGSNEPRKGRIDLIEHTLPRGLADPNILSGKGNRKGALIYSPSPTAQDGTPIPWYGSEIHGLPQGGNQVRQYTTSLFFSDESAFQSEYMSAMIALSASTTDAKSISVSSVQAGSAFNDMVLASPTQEVVWDNELPVVVKDDGTEVPALQIALDALGWEWPMRGIRTRKTAAGAQVLEVHHNADPKKDMDTEAGMAWAKKAVKKPAYEGSFDSVGWRTEMDIDYGAGGGEQVFPFLRHDSPILVPPIPEQEALNRFRFFGGYDYGTTNPSHFGVWGTEVVDGQMHAYKVWELHEPCVNLNEHVDKMRSCPYWPKIEYIVCDWSLMNKNQRNWDGELQAVSEQFQRLGVEFIRGRRGADIAWQSFLKGGPWSDPERPTVFITRSCPDTIGEYMEARWQQHMSEAVAARKSNPEKIRDKNNHSIDADAGLWITFPPAAGIEKPKKTDWSVPPITGQMIEDMFIEKELRGQKRGNIDVR